MGPGGVDGHVHLAQDRSPRARAAGYVSADTSKLENLYSFCTANNYTLVETGTTSAVAGGTTTVLLFAEQAKDQSLKEQGSYTDYGFHAIITDPTEGSIRE